MAPFYGWGSNASRLEPFLGGSLLFTTKFPETTLIKHIKAWEAKSVHYCTYGQITDVKVLLLR